MSGFFSPSSWQQQKTPISLVSDCERCGLYKGCISPKMAPSGTRSRVLIIAEAPGENEDERGTQLIGNAGSELMRIIYEATGLNMRREATLTNAVICRPRTATNRNREPTKVEINACRPNLLKTLSTLKPEVIIPLGKIAVESLMEIAWKAGEVSDIGTWVGWQIPCGKLNAWICPTYHPSFLLREKSPVAEMMTAKHLAKAFSLRGRPYPNGQPDWKSRVDVCLIDDWAYSLIGSFIGSKPVAFDYETTHLKPDKKDAAILCCSLSNGERTVAFPWTPRTALAMRDFLLSNTPKLTANLQMEWRWSVAKLGIYPKNMATNGGWDTTIGAHWLDPRHGITGLKMQSFIHLGVESYDHHIEEFRKGKDSNSPNRLREVEMRDLCMYCGLDSLFTVLVTQKQRSGL